MVTLEKRASTKKLDSLGARTFLQAKVKTPSLSDCPPLTHNFQIAASAGDEFSASNNASGNKILEQLGQVKTSSRRCN